MTTNTVTSNEGRIVVLTKKADSDSANGAVDQFVGTFADLYTKKALTFNAADSYLYFNGEEDGQWFTITDNYSGYNAGSVYINMYGDPDKYLKTSGYNVSVGSSQPFYIYEMVAE